MKAAIVNLGQIVTGDWQSPLGRGDAILTDGERIVSVGTASAQAVDAADVVIVMDFLNEAELLARFPQAKGKVFLLGEFDRECRSSGLEIPDPYRGDLETVRASYVAVARAVARLAAVVTELVTRPAVEAR